MIVMERPSNFMDLFDVVGTYGRLDEQIARQIFTQVTTAVVQLYRRHSIVHRDIKVSAGRTNGDSPSGGALETIGK